MLGKLLKYEIPAMGRKLVPLYIAWMAVSLVLGFATQLEENGSAMLFVGLLYGFVVVAIMVMMVILIVQRYGKSLLGDEAYFNQVLPVTTSEHIANKLISALVWVVITTLAAIVSGLVMGLSAWAATGFDGITDVFNNPEINFDIPGFFWLNALEVIILGVATTTKTIMQIYAAITIGHQAQNRTTMASIGAYIGILTFESILGSAVMAIAPAIDKFERLNEVFIPGLLGTILISAVYFFVCKYLMEKRLNLD